MARVAEWFVSANLFTIFKGVKNFLMKAGIAIDFSGNAPDRRNHGCLQFSRSDHQLCTTEPVDFFNNFNENKTVINLLLMITK